jgi:transaldolase/glucose-6-phosphate isomerase
MVAACSPSVAVTENPALALGAALGELALGGRDKVTFIASAAIASLPTWLEQLIAESTGKDGKGILPVVDEELDAPEAYGHDRVFVYLYVKGDEDGETRQRVLAVAGGGHPVIEYGLDDPSDIGGEFVRWEIAVAAAGAVLDIHPFNQPDVQLAKDLARQAMAGGVNADSNEAPTARALSVTTADDETPLARDIDAWLDTAQEGDYVGIHAYLAHSAATTAALQRVRAALWTRLRLATTVGYGPRFLHSTGQLHKGGPNTGLFLQITDEPPQDLSVPETDYSFGSLISAQAAGDAMALVQRGRRVIRVELGRDAAGGLERLAAAIGRH